MVFEPERFQPAHNLGPRVRRVHISLQSILVDALRLLRVLGDQCLHRSIVTRAHVPTCP